MTTWLYQALRRASRVALLLAPLLGTTACVSGQPVRTLEDGTLQVSCPGGYNDWSACQAAAQKKCGEGKFRVVNQISNEGGAVGVGDWSHEGSEVARVMEFRCVP